MRQVVKFRPPVLRDLPAPIHADHQQKWRLKARNGSYEAVIEPQNWVCCAAHFLRLSIPAYLPPINCVWSLRCLCPHRKTNPAPTKSETSVARGRSALPAGSNSFSTQIPPRYPAVYHYEDRRGWRPLPLAAGENKRNRPCDVPPEKSARSLIWRQQRHACDDASR